MEQTEKQHIPGINFAHKTFKMFSVMMLVQAISVVISIITARSLGPAGKGIFTIVNLYPGVLLTVLGMGIYRAATIYVAEAKYEFSCFPASILAYGVISGIIGILLFFAAYFAMPQLFIHQASVWLILMAVLMTPFLFVHNTFSSLLEVKNRITLINIKDIFNSLVLLVSMIMALCVFKAGVTGAVSAYFISNFLTAALLIFFVRRLSQARWRVDLDLLGKLIKDGAKLQIPMVANFVSFRIDSLMLGQYKPSSSVGYYSIAVSITELLFVISLALQTAFYSGMIDMIKDKKEMTRKAMAVYRNSLLLFFLGGLSLIIFGRWIILLFFGKAFAPSFMPLLILLPGSIMLYSHNVLGNYLVGNKRFFLFSAICSISAVLNVILNVIFIPRYDFIGAAFTSTFTYSVTALLLILAFLKISGMSFKEFISGLRFKKEDLSVYKGIFKALLPKEEIK